MYGSHPNDQIQPLFGESSRRSKIVNMVVAGVTAVLVTVTVILSVISGRILTNKCDLIFQSSDFCVYPIDILFAAVILLLLVPQVFVVLWYRRGELEPKFRRMIYYNAFVTMLLCIVANLYFFQVDIKHDTICPPPSNTTTKITS